MNGVDSKLLILQASVSFYRRQMMNIGRIRCQLSAARKMREIHLRLAQLNRDIDRILQQ